MSPQINQEICKICIEGNAKASKSRDTARNPVYIVKTTYYIWYLNCIYKRYKSFLGDPIKDLIWDSRADKSLLLVQNGTGV